MTAKKKAKRPPKARGHAYEKAREVEPPRPSLSLHEACERALTMLEKMTPEEAFALAVRAGIYRPEGGLTPYYRDDGPPSACRPTD